MSKDKYPSMFSRQMEATVFMILEIFFATNAVLNIELKNITGIFMSLRWGIFCDVTCLNRPFPSYLKPLFQSEAW